jgi:hypothetical protein
MRLTWEFPWDFLASGVPHYETLLNAGAAYKTTAVLLIDMVNNINITRKLSYMLRTL